MRAVVFDLDGSLSDTRHRDHYLDGDKDWDLYLDACGYDPPIEAATWLASQLRRGNRIFCVTGRSERVRTATERWLIEHNVPWDELLMRSVHDFRPNVEIKVEHAQRIKRDHTIKLWMEDNPKSIRALCELGVPVLAVHTNGGLERGSRPPAVDTEVADRP